MNAVTAVYSLRLIGSDRLYIGSAVNLRNRFKGHVSLLRHGKHHAAALQDEANRIGLHNLTVSIIEAVSDPLDLIEREQYWIDQHPISWLLNTSPSAQNRLGAKMPASARAAISKSLIGNQYRKGIPHGDDIRRKIADGMRKAIAEGRRPIKFDRDQLKRNNDKVSSEGKARASIWLEQWKAGKSVEEIATETGFDKSTVRKSLKRYFGISHRREA